MANTKSTKTNLLTQNGDETGLISAERIITGVGITREQLAERDERLARIKKLKTEEGQRISSKYWEAREGDVIRGIFRGYIVLKKKLDAAEIKIAEEKGEKIIEGNLKPIPAVAIDTADGIRICGAMNILELFQAGVPTDSAVEVKCTHSKSGEMKTFEVVVLDEGNEDDSE